MMRVFFEPTFLYQPQLINCYQLGLIPERDVLFGTRLQQHRIALLFVNTDSFLCETGWNQGLCEDFLSRSLSAFLSANAFIFTSSTEMQ